jgi:predicted RNA binding protein YcfA (HicA-like mRNA interferase family)
LNREQLIRALRKLARKQGVAFDVETAKGKGSHYRVKFAGRVTTVQHDLNPGRIARILKQLEIDPVDL